MFTQDFGRMTEIPLDLESSERDRRLYRADSLNNLHRMSLCADPDQLLSVPASSSQSADRGGMQGPGDTPESHKAGALSFRERLVKWGEATDLEGRQDGQAWCRRSRLLAMLLVILAVALVTSLALSAYTVYLIVQTTEKMDEFSNSDMERQFLEEIKQWKALMLKYMDPTKGVAK